MYYILQTFLDLGASTNYKDSRGLTPLYYSVLYIVPVYYVLQTFLDLGASTNYKDSRGLTPLYYSVLYGKNANCTEMLLHERAHVGVQDEQGWYEIHQVSNVFFSRNNNKNF